MNDEQQRLGSHHFIEQLASILETEGLPRMFGRVFGTLLICDPRHQSSAQLAEILHASRGSISTATRALAQTGLIQRRRIKGDRATYFEVPNDAADRLFHGLVARVALGRAVIDQGLAVIEGTDTDPTRLNTFRDAYLFLEQEFPSMLERWDSQKEKT